MYDSKEEELFHHWLLELQHVGLIKKIEIQPHFDLIDKKLLNLKVKTKNKDCSFIRSLSYTADFKIVWNSNYNFITFGEGSLEITAAISKLIKHKLYVSKQGDDWVSYVDVKPTFAYHKLTTSITFPILQKVVYELKDVYVQKVVPLDKNGILANTFTPFKFWFTKTGKLKKFKFKKKTLYSFIKEKYVH